jgi:hypothetical protein
VDGAAVTGTARRQPSTAPGRERRGSPQGRRQLLLEP